MAVKVLFLRCRKAEFPFWFGIWFARDWFLWLNHNLFFWRIPPKGEGGKNGYTMKALLFMVLILFLGKLTPWQASF